MDQNMRFFDNVGIKLILCTTVFIFSLGCTWDITIHDSVTPGVTSKSCLEVTIEHHRLLSEYLAIKILEGSENVGGITVKALEPHIDKQIQGLPPLHANFHGAWTLRSSINRILENPEGFLSHLNNTPPKMHAITHLRLLEVATQQLNDKCGLRVAEEFGY